MAQVRGRGSWGGGMGVVSKCGDVAGVTRRGRLVCHINHHASSNSVIQ